MLDLPGAVRSTCNLTGAPPTRRWTYPGVNLPGGYTSFFTKSTYPAVHLPGAVLWTLNLRLTYPGCLLCSTTSTHPGVGARVMGRPYPAVTLPGGYGQFFTKSAYPAVSQPRRPSIRVLGSSSPRVHGPQKGIRVRVRAVLTQGYRFRGAKS